MQAINLQRVGSNSSLHTPIKYPSTSFTTNPSLAFSNSFITNTYEFSQNKGSPSYQLLKQYNAYETESVKAQEMMDNNSALTLNPVVSQHDIEDIFTMRRLICFYAKQSQEQKHVIYRKQHRIVQLKEEIELKQSNIKYHKQRYNRSIKSLTKSKSKKKLQQKRKYEKQEEQIIAFQLEIKNIKKNLEHVKYPKPTRNNIRKILRQDEQRSKHQYYPKRNLVFMPPIPYYGYPYPGYFPHPNSDRPPSNPMPQQGPMLQSQTWNRQQATGRTQANSAPGAHTNPTFNMLFTNLNKKQENPQIRQSKLDPSAGLITDEDIEIVDKMQGKRSYHISVNKANQGQSPKNLNYFNDDQSEISWREQDQPGTLQASKKSADKWVGDDDDMQTIQLIEKSTANRMKHSRKATLDPPARKRGIDAKIVTSRLCEHEKTDSNSASKVDISFESEGRGPSNPRKLSDDKKSNGSNSRLSAKQSNVNIIIQSFTSPDKNSMFEGSPSAAQASRKKSIEKKISSIIQQDEDAVTTPIPTTNSSSLKIQSPKKSRYINQSNPRESFTGKNSLQYSNSGMGTPPIDKPPSLKEIQSKINLRESQQIEELANIKLSAHSVTSKQSKPRDSNCIKNSLKSQEEDCWDDLELTAKSIKSKQKPQLQRQNSSESIDDDISGIKLLIQSRHSRQCSLTSNHQRLQDIPTRNLMAQSQPNWSPKRTSSEVRQQQKEQQQLAPTTSKSTIVRDSSAIDRVKARSRASELRVSSSPERSALQRSTAMLAEPIHQASEQEQQYSKVIQSKRNRLSMQ